MKIEKKSTPTFILVSINYVGFTRYESHGKEKLRKKGKGDWGFLSQRDGTRWVKDPHHKVNIETDIFL